MLCYLWSCRYCLLDKRKRWLVRYSGGSQFPIFLYIFWSTELFTLCYSSSMYILIYVVMLFWGAKRGTTHVLQVLHVWTNPGGGCIFLMARTSYFSSVCQLIDLKDLVNYYWGCNMHTQHILVGNIPWTVCLMGLDLIFFREPLKNVTTSFADAAFTVFSLKRFGITFTTKGAVTWYLCYVNCINNLSRLNSQMIATKYCHWLLLQIVTEVINRIVPGFWVEVDMGKVTIPPPGLVQTCNTCKTWVVPLFAPQNNMTT